MVAAALLYSRADGSRTALRSTLTFSRPLAFFSRSPNVSSLDLLSPRSISPTCTTRAASSEPTKSKHQPSDASAEAVADTSTPLGNNHLGSIVLCLPSSFEGGELVVRHQDQKAVFDFAKDVNAAEPAVSWVFSPTSSTKSFR